MNLQDLFGRSVQLTWRILCSQIRSGFLLCHRYHLLPPAGDALRELHQDQEVRVARGRTAGEQRDWTGVHTLKSINQSIKCLLSYKICEKHLIFPPFLIWSFPSPSFRRNSPGVAAALRWTSSCVSPKFPFCHVCFHQRNVGLPLCSFASDRVCRPTAMKTF